MTDSLTPDIVTEPTTAIAVVDRGTPLPVFSGEEMAGAFQAYRQLQQTLDRAMPDQIMTISGRKFRKKGYWRSIRTAFNLAVEMVTERRDDVDGDWGYLVIYRATAPNGRFADGDGACYASEKTGRGQLSVHNVRSHAHSRAFNRAVSNLVGFGEVSAEEAEREPRQQTSGQRAGDDTTISDAQRKRFYVLAKKAGWVDAELKSWLEKAHGLTSTRDIKRGQYEALCTYVETHEPDVDEASDSAEEDDRDVL